MSEPPSGTVTFLFSDIEGSTRLLKALREDYAQVLATHHRLVRAAIARGDGYEVDTAGDAFFAAFGQARQAVLSAVGIQRALTGQPWPAGSPVRVRIGIHTGQASWSGESYTGLAVHRAARICSAASGGQVLLSQATATILADEEAEEDFGLADLGERQLKDLDRPVRLYQVVAPGLASPDDIRVPPDRAPAHGGLRGFPAPLTSYIGRARAVSEVAARLGQHRLVTVTGPGGVGKTRLSGEVARRVASGFADGAWLTELAQVPDPAQVAPAVAAALGVRVPAGITAADALVAVLARQQLLLVLDNCEQVVAAVAGLCAALLPACDDLRILATSREPLRIAGEARYRLAPLGLPAADRVDSSEAMELFADRARQADPDFVLTGEAGPAAARLVRRLDGMPLAIELAAARVEALGGVAQLLDLLDDQLALLDGGNRLAAGRHQSLAATVEWSYRLLEPAEQRVFRALSAFPGPFTLAAAEGVAGGGSSPAVLRLVDCSLLVPPRPGPDGLARYVMLETLRGYGATQLVQAGERDGVQAALARYAAGLVQEARAGLEGTQTELPAARRLDAEEATVVQTLWWAADHDPLLALRLATGMAYWWMLRGRLTSQYQLLARLAGQVTAGHPAWCEAHYWLGQAAAFSADLATALTHLSTAIDVLAAREPSPLLADCLALRSTVLANQNRIAEALGEGQRAAAMSRALRYPDGEAMALGGLSIATSYAGDREEAVRLARQAAGFGDVSGAVARVCLSILVNMLLEAGDVAAAGEVCARAMAWCRDAEDAESLAILLVRQSILDLETGQTGPAAAHLREAVDVGSRSGNRVELANALTCGGELAVAIGRFAEAVTLWGAFDAIAADGLFADLPHDFPRRAAVVAQARQALDPAQAQAAEDRGRAMSFATAVELVLAITDPTPAAARDLTLTDRERELVTLVGRGHTDTQIASELDTSAGAVGAELGRIRDKTGATRRSDLTRLALDAGLA